MVMRTFVAVAALWLASCGTPDSIKQLSQEQLAVQADLRTVIDLSFTRMEEVAGAVMADIDAQNAAANRALLIKGAEYVSAPDSNLTAEQFADDMLKGMAERSALVAAARENFGALKQAHQNILHSIDKLTEAQKTLDEYLRLEQADEKIVNELLQIVGLARGDLDRWMSKGSDALSAINQVHDALGG